MKSPWLIFALSCVFPVFVHAEEPKIAAVESGIALPPGFQDFRLIGVSQRSDSQTLRAILGNDVAVAAARSGQTKPWPNGAVLVKLVWKQKQSDKFPAATVPGEFSAAAVMVKDQEKFAATAGWGWGEWSGLALKPADKPGFAQECVACHAAVKDQDWVFTQAAKLP